MLRAAPYSANVVVGLLHGGTPEDRELLDGAPGLDLVVAGHEHEIYAATQEHPSVQAFEFGRAFGVSYLAVPPAVGKS